MSRPQRYGRDSHFVTDGTVNAVKRIVYILHAIDQCMH